MNPGLVRSLGLLLPILLAAGLWLWRRPDQRLSAAFLLACLWNAPALLALHLLAQRLGWWHFQAQGGLFWGIPVDLYLGWCLIWGGIPLLAFLDLPLLWGALLIFYLDWLTMPLLQPVLQLGPQWWLGETLGLALCFLPAQWLGRWTFRNQHLSGRVLLQAGVFSGWLGLVLPALALEAGRISGVSLAWSDPWTALAAPPWQTSLVLQLLAFLALPGLSAVQEFSIRGGGTPLPYDPPARLVTSGLYAYLANPMQCSACLLALAMGLWWGNGWLLLSALVFLAYSAGLAAWHEEAELVERFGEAWSRYRAAVRPWLPRWRPYVPEPATLYVSATCPVCRPLGQWLQAHRPTGLAILPAEGAPETLRRMRYQSPGGYSADGLEAWARALEHLNLAWALAGCCLRLPLVRSLLQRIVDVSGGGPRDLARPK